MQKVLGNKVIKCPESYKGFITLVTEDLTGRTEQKNRRLERELEEETLRQIIPKRVKRDFRTERLIKEMEEETLRTVKAPDYLIPVEKSARVLKLCLYRIYETKNKKGFDYQGAKKIARITRIPYHICLRALVYTGDCKRRGEFIMDYDLHSVMETLARARL